MVTGTDQGVLLAAQTGGRQNLYRGKNRRSRKAVEL